MTNAMIPTAGEGVKGMSTWKNDWRDVPELNISTAYNWLRPLIPSTSGGIWHDWAYSPICGGFLPQYTWPGR